ncbi:MAG: metallophosphoesterase family protein [Rickettsiales bacterium]|nr:metallophosphoesterase family protein [Rickettsiales bacterium]
MANDQKHPLKQGIIISDLHLFGNISRFKVRGAPAKQLDDWLKDKDYCVLNGDIFELLYTSSTDNAIEYGIRWLKRLCEKYPQCEFHYVLGNHDAVDEFIHRVEELSRNDTSDPSHAIPNLVFHKHRFKMGNMLCVHGDEYMHSTPTKRYEYSVSEAKKYNSANSLSQNQIQELFYPTVKYYFRNPDAASKIVYTALSNNPKLNIQDYEHVVFGHTHVPFTNHSYQGIHFHNTGGFTTLAKPNPVLFDFDPMTVRTSNVRSLFRDRHEFTFPTDKPIDFTYPPNTSIPKRLLVISDTHDYTTLSTFTGKIRHNFIKQIPQVNAVVFNGDIHDIICADNAEKAIEKAVKWYRELAQANPKQEFHVILGNHEAVKPFLAAMEEVCAKQPNLHFHPHALQLGDALFVHGNEWIGLTGSTQKEDNDFMPQQTKSLKDASKTNSGWSRFLYEAGRGLFQEARDTYCDFHIAAPIIDKILRKSTHPILEALHLDTTHVKHVFYGHTHIPFIAYAYNKRYYHNTGAFMRSASAAPMIVEFDQGQVASVKAIDLGQGLQFGLDEQKTRSAA